MWNSTRLLFVARPSPRVTSPEPFADPRRPLPCPPATECFRPDTDARRSAGEAGVSEERRSAGEAGVSEKRRSADAGVSEERRSADEGVTDARRSAEAVGVSDVRRSADVAVAVDGRRAGVAGEGVSAGYADGLRDARRALASAGLVAAV